MLQVNSLAIGQAVVVAGFELGSVHWRCREGSIRWQCRDGGNGEGKE